MNLFRRRWSILWQVSSLNEVSRIHFWAIWKEKVENYEFSWMNDAPVRNCFFALLRHCKNCNCVAQSKKCIFFFTLCSPIENSIPLTNLFRYQQLEQLHVSIWITKGIIFVSSCKQQQKIWSFDAFNFNSFANYDVSLPFV